MEIAKIRQLVDEKKWRLVHHELGLKILEIENSKSDNESIIQIFENMDRDYRDRYAANLYLAMWKIALRSGKIKLAKSYAEIILSHLIEFKRIPALKKLIIELSEEGLFHQYKKFQMVDVILGKKTNTLLEDYTFFEFHSEMWKKSKNILKSYLLEEEDWSVSNWKLAYEYILKFYYDKDIFLNLAERAIVLKKDKYADSFLSFLRERKVNLKAFELKTSPVAKIKEDLFLVDYDQLAMDVISGDKAPSITEQRRILASIKNLTEDELLEKGKDMIVAFGLLGMDKVVVSLCEKMLFLIKDPKERISLQFMLAQAHYNNNNFYKACDVVDDTFEKEPLLPEEANALSYMKAESLFRLKKYKIAKELFLKIKKYNPHYRLVGERLREIEAAK